MSRKADYLPYGRQSIDADDILAVTEALKSDFLTTGPRVAEFEAAFAKATGARCAVACNSGTAALHLAAMALDLGPGRAAVVPSMTFLATANAVRMTGAEVVFADVEGETGLLTSETLADALGRAKAAGLSVRAALPVHLNGQLCDMTALGDIAREHGIALVTDACHALGLPGVGATEHTLMACFSTHPVKAIATGEGGVVTTADEAIAARMRQLRSHGMTANPDDFQNQELAVEGNETNPWYYEMHEIGWNYRLPDVLCALGISQLGKLERFHRRRNEIAALYDELLAPLAPTIRPVPHPRPHGWHLYVLLIDFPSLGTTRRRFMQALRARGVGTQVHYIPVHLQPYYRNRYGRQQLHGAERYYAHCLSIPMFPAMNDDDVQHVVRALRDTVAA
jgi:UDP-4-amino-4,6-dideoxy-N-acetyl-beta-L-altrosamine transaminase